MTLHLVKQVFRQESHCCASEDVDPALEVELMDGGGGEFLVFRATEWAVDDDVELKEVVDVLRLMLNRAKKGRPK